jgi:F-type H+-transporting ATPase subunit delta
VSRRSAEVGARIYAEALAAAAEAKGMLEQVGEELKALATGRGTAGSLVAAFFGSSAVRREQKAAKIEAAFRGRTSDLFVDFLLVLLSRNRLGLVGDVDKAYGDILDRRGSRVRVTLTTAADVGVGDLEAWTARLRPLLGGREPIVRLRKDPALIAGMVLKTGDWVADGSARRVLKELRERLAHAGRASSAS